MKPWTSCSVKKTDNGNTIRQTVIGTGIPADLKQTSRMTFKDSQSVETGVGIDFLGDSGGWKYGGTLTESGSFMIDWKATSTARNYTLGMLMGKYHEVCYYEPGHQDMHTKDTWRGDMLTGGYSQQNATNFPAKYCTGPVGVGTFTRNSSSGTAFSLAIGFRIKDLIGFDVSSKSNYDVDNALIYRQPTHLKYQLCGDDRMPSKARRVKGAFA